MIIERFVKVSRFTEHFKTLNGLDDSQLYSWIFLAEMLFGAPQKWWGDCQDRRAPHEGLDFCLFQDKAGGIYRFTNEIRIPAMYAGTVVSIIPDYLGRSVLVEQKACEDQGHFLAIYGHLSPRDGLNVGDVLSEGDDLGTVSLPNNPLVGILPHLHVSIAGVLGEISYQTLNWERIVYSNDLGLVDPLDLLDGPQLAMKRDELYEVSIKPFFH
jgi:hypothetical protein